MSTYKLANLIRARFPMIYITTYEEDRVTKYIKSVVTDEKQVKYAREVFTWTQTNGLFNDTTQKGVADTTCPCKALEFVRKYDKDAVFIMYDFHVNFGPKGRQPDYNTIRKVRDIIPDLKLGTVRKTVFFVSTELLIPESLQKEITIFDFALPTLEEIKAKFESMINQNSSVVNELSEEDKDKLCKAALGLTLQEAESAFALAMVNDGKINIKDLQIVLEEKVQVIKKTGILEFIRSEKGEYPVLLLDDVMSELDVNRRQQLLDFIKKEKIQTIITATDKAYFDEDTAGVFYCVENGNVDLIGRK